MITIDHSSHVTSLQHFQFAPFHDPDCQPWLQPRIASTCSTSMHTIPKCTARVLVLLAALAISARCLYLSPGLQRQRRTASSKFFLTLHLTSSLICFWILCTLLIGSIAAISGCFSLSCLSFRFVFLPACLFYLYSRVFGTATAFSRNSFISSITHLLARNAFLVPA